jgi:hypothetical protein
MKRLSIFLITALMLVSSIAMGQVSLEKQIFGNRSYFTQFPSTLIDSVTNVYSEVFTLNGWDQGLSSSNPVHWTRILTSTKGKPRITVIVQGSNDETNWLSVDTLSVKNDSTETFGYGTMSFNTYKYAYYRFKVQGDSGNRTDTYAKFEIYLPYRREN